jgi:hypothetical protein
MREFNKPKCHNEKVGEGQMTVLTWLGGVQVSGHVCKNELITIKPPLRGTKTRHKMQQILGKALCHSTSLTKRNSVTMDCQIGGMSKKRDFFSRLNLPGIMPPPAEPKSKKSWTGRRP